MRQRSGLECGGKVTDIGAQEEPLQRADVSLRLSNTTQNILTKPPRTGSVAPTMATKASVMTMGGLVGASLKMWWISGCLPYRAASAEGTGTLGSRSIDSLKTGLSYASELPKEPITTDASTGSDRERNWRGSSF